MVGSIGSVDATKVGDPSNRFNRSHMRKRGMPSPDSADAMALTFSEPDGSPIPRSMALNFNRQLVYPNMGVV
jgi:hypothetical protein